MLQLILRLVGSNWWVKAKAKPGDEGHPVHWALKYCTAMIHYRHSQDIFVVGGCLIIVAVDAAVVGKQLVDGESQSQAGEVRGTWCTAGALYSVH